MVGIVAWTVFLPDWFWATAAAVVGRRDPRDAAPARRPVPRWEGSVALALAGYVCFLNVTGSPSSSAAPFLPSSGGPRSCCRSISSGACSRRSRPGGAASWWRAERPWGGEMVDLLVDGEPRGAGAPLPPPSGRFGRDRWRAYFNYLRRQPADARERLGRRWTYLGRQLFSVNYFGRSCCLI